MSDEGTTQPLSVLRDRGDEISDRSETEEIDDSNDNEHR